MSKCANGRLEQVLEREKLVPGTSSGISQLPNPQNQDSREESIFKGNDISKSSKVQQDQHFERAKADSGPRSEVSRRANSQDRNSRQTSIFKGHGTSTSSKGVYETDQEESILPKHMVEQLEMWASKYARAGRNQESSKRLGGSTKFYLF